MSDAKDTKTPDRAKRGGGRGFGPGGGMHSAPVAKAKDFKDSALRLLATLRPQQLTIAFVIVLAIISVAFQRRRTQDPRPGDQRAVRGRHRRSSTPPARAQAQVIAALKRQGPDPARRHALGRRLHPGERRGLHGARPRSCCCSRPSTCSARSSRGCRATSWRASHSASSTRCAATSTAKLARLPLRYFDDHARGDILSRVTNDIDNIANTLQQSLTQIITAVLTVIGVLAMMFWINSLLATISLLTVPLSVVITIFIAKRSQKQFAAQWERTGKLNGHVEEMHTGRSIVKVFGRQEEAIAQFDEENEKLYDASFKAQFISGIIQPAITFVGNLNYVAIAVIGGVQVASGTLSLGDVQAFIQYSRQFTWPITQIASIANVMQSAVASAERVFELLDEAEEKPDAVAPTQLADVTGCITLRDVSFRYEADTPLIEDLEPRREAGADRRDRRAHRRRQDHARQPAAALLRDRPRHASASTASTPAT